MFDQRDDEAAGSKTIAPARVHRKTRLEEGIGIDHSSLEFGPNDRADQRAGRVKCQWGR